jgi:branched-chain amino acid transport system permease protein
MWGGLGGGVDLIIFGFLIVVIIVKQPAGIAGVVREIAKRYRRRTDAVKGGASLGAA